MRSLDFYRQSVNLRFTGAIIACLLLSLTNVYSQKAPTDQDRDRAHVMLQAIKGDLKKNYYDPNFHGIDLEARFKTADENLKRATSLAQLFGVIAQALDDLNDSHTFFLPPGRYYRTEYGWQMQIVGDKCFVVAVKPGSDAEAKGLKPGDQVYSIDGIAPVKENMWKIQYLYHALRPRPGMRVVVIRPDGSNQQLDVAAKIEQGKREQDLVSNPNDIAAMIRSAESRLQVSRYAEEGKDLFIWKMPDFEVDPEDAAKFIDKFQKHKALILDLRGNPGGYEETLLRMLGRFFDHDVKLGELQRRKEKKTLTAKTQGQPFAGRLVVLIDSGSGSAAELFARVIQLEKRGTIIGDVSSGAVMRSILYDHQVGLDVIVPYAVSVTDADIVMTDGKSLEHMGVVPDEIKLPTASDLAAGRDPVLAYAASLVGVTLTPEKAGALFPIEWKKQ
jgi:carboxyl-terminal processing protease